MRFVSDATNESRRFAIELIQRSRTAADAFTARVYGDAPHPLQGAALVALLETNMWREYVLGVQGPAKLMTLLPDAKLPLKHLLATQIVDELRHSDVFAARARALGGRGDLLAHEPAPEDWALVEATLGFDDPAELVTSLNCTGEVILQQTFLRLVERGPGRPPIVGEETAAWMERELIDEAEEAPAVLDDATAAALREDVIPDEGRHVKIGRLILQELATTPEVRARCLTVQERKLAALDLAHGRTMADAKRLAAEARPLAPRGSAAPGDQANASLR